MAEGASSAYTSLGLGDLFALFGSSNPLSGISKSVGQFQKGVAQFLESVERFNDTMDQLNQVARRVNGLLDAVEEPVRAIVPQLTRTIKTADLLVEQMSSVPRDLGQFVDVLADLARRLQPLGQLAESAGSMFGLRPLAALRTGSARPAAPASAPPPPPQARKAPAKKAVARTSSAKKSTAKKPVAKKPVAKNPAAKKPAAKKAAARR